MKTINSNILNEDARAYKPSDGIEAGSVEPHPQYQEHFAGEDIGFQANNAVHFPQNNVLDQHYAEYVHIQENPADANQQLAEEIGHGISDDNPVMGGYFCNSNIINDEGVQRIIKIGKISHQEGQELLVCDMAYRNSRDEHIKFNRDKFFHSKIG